MDPSRPFDADAIPAHWIFIDGNWPDRLLASDGSDVLSGDRRLLPETGGSERSAPTMGEAPDRHVRMPELEDRTGLSRATIYRRIGSGRFPHKIEMDGIVSVWRESEVAKWLANPC